MVRNINAYCHELLRNIIYLLSGLSVPMQWVLCGKITSGVHFYRSIEVSSALLVHTK